MFALSFSLLFATVLVFALPNISIAQDEAGTETSESSASEGTTETGREAEPFTNDAVFEFWRNGPIGPISYRAGRGFRFGETGLNIGGFGTIEFDRAEGKALETAFDTLSFLVLYEPIESFRIFAEVEVGELFTHEARGATNSDPRVQTERLYAELSLSDSFNLQFGKFQTPIGRWNLVPAEPFVWTANDPVQLDFAFDEHQTGVTVHGTFFPTAGALDYWLYGQVLDPLDPSDSPSPASRSLGGRVQFTRPLQDWSIGASLLATRRKGAWSGLGGLDAELRLGRFEFLAEAVFQDGGIADRRLAGVFGQASVEVLRDFRLVARYEYFDRLGTKHDDAHIGDLGFAWQPRDWLLLKATYRLADQETDDVERGLTSSISVVF